MIFSKKNIATFLALLFHICGWIGIVYSPYKDWFIANTPVNLCLMVVLLLWNQPGKNLGFFLFFAIVFLAGMGTEMIGTNTGKLFGSYTYGTVLGAKFNGVPWLIGLNWFVVIFCSGSCIYQFQEWIIKRVDAPVMSRNVKAISFIIDSAIMATFFDWVLEPVAIKLGYWQWQNNEVPIYNYICWFIISAMLLALFWRFSFQKTNHFAVHLFIIQLLFFLALRTR